MKMKFVVSAIAACTLMSGAALAEQDRNKHKRGSSAASVAAGVAAAGPQGAVAGGGAASEVRQDRRGNRRAMANQRSTERCVPGTASTSTSGAVYSDRTRASAAGTTSGTASGSGTNTASSDIDASAYTDRQGSDSYVTGGSTAVAREPTRRC